MTHRKTGHSFSVELYSRDSVKQIEFSTNSEGAVTIEGYLGDTAQLRVIENTLLEIEGSLGFLRIDLNESMIKELKVIE